MSDSERTTIPCTCTSPPRDTSEDDPPGDEDPSPAVAPQGEGYENSGYVLVNELGHPWKTDKLRREAYKLMTAAGVRKVRLYDARHACLSWMANNGVPDTVVSAWAGHSDLSFTKQVYVHPDPESLRASLRAGSDKLGELLG